MSKFVWEADAAAGKCWVVYETTMYFRGSSMYFRGSLVRKAVLTVWGTNPPEMTGLPKYAYNNSIKTMLNVTSELNGGTLPDNVMDAVVTTMELLE